jgi:hypothetical protein
MVFAGWRATDSGRIEITWSNGFTGVNFNLRMVSSGPQGTAETFSDAPGGVYRPEVHAQPVACPQ